jgi:hypothetical protein
VFLGVCFTVPFFGKFTASLLGTRLAGFIGHFFTAFAYKRDARPERAKRPIKENFTSLII